MCPWTATPCAIKLGQTMERSAGSDIQQQYFTIVTTRARFLEDDVEGMMLRDLLWKLNADIAKRCLEHPFVRGLGDGTLDRQAFRRYLAQDAFFLRAFLQAYALAAARSDDLEQGRVFHELMGGVLDEPQASRRVRGDARHRH